MLQQLERAETLRREISPRITRKRKAELGQFMTPSSVARFMASLFPQNTGPNCRLLDPGAGVGARWWALIDRWTKGGFDFDSVDVFAYEIDESLRSHLCKNLSAYNGVRPHVFGGDFIGLADQPLLSG
jgi:type I restriction-modification system DNA methylase subunit